MTENEYRALIEFHARELANLNEEPKPGYGVPKKDTILRHVNRMKELASNLEG